MKKYEYLVLTRSYKHGLLSSGEYWLDDDKDRRTLQQRLSALGQEGWKLVSSSPVAQDIGMGSAGLTTYTEYIFIRPVES